ncbi:ABC transporter ATP-binding protein [Anabaenopsis tanganyikae CS-531]|uniref:ABC transporter ATP-binding protein n=2 Tax=Anabaenopsis TaxID=110103 RepID=A0ABT5ATD9_9CYAN|nr:MULTISPECIES: ABC transporter ATP-binding protein [Anabaenopsis]MDB9540588.1 ABC transporter ATP-binding protein [Anabaenopsis arnoldii]MDH6093026.1 ABC transporter ATP-binding protein [Anabaenopsis arnoldii]MDH6098675.1 ABC transporter ATP-binding protein [Anabaenopsis sp. FSS-46]MDH6105808.1 ABC transporter ATP-binding protein [Anabaenopsis tanganyikae CS-531]
MVKELAIRTCGLTKQFDQHIVVNNVDLEIPEGEVYGLIGPNGSGKTTLIRMLVTAEQPTTGEIYLYGHPLEFDKSNSTLKRRLGYLPDNYPLYEDLTVWDYLDYFARLYHLREPYRTQRLHAVLELIQLENKRQALISTLSRGMKQRLGLARAIIHEPILLILDEPVSGLDPIARMQFRDIITALQSAGMTILISSHILSDLAELCTSIGIMELGCLVETASLEEIYQRFSQQHIILSTPGSLELIEQELQNYSLVQSWQKIPGENSLKVSFTGTPKDGADLLRSLVLSGCSISNFHSTQEDLESIFLKLGHKQAS